MRERAQQKTVGNKEEVEEDERRGWKSILLKIKVYYDGSLKFQKRERDRGEENF